MEETGDSRQQADGSHTESFVETNTSTSFDEGPIQQPSSTAVESTDSESSEDPTFGAEQELSADPALRLEQFVEEWVVSLDHDN